MYVCVCVCMHIVCKYTFTQTHTEEIFEQMQPTEETPGCKFRSWCQAHIWQGAAVKKRWCLLQLIPTHLFHSKQKERGFQAGIGIHELPDI